MPRLLALTALLLLGTSSAALAQTTNVVYGTVSDSLSGQPLEGAVVQLAHTDGGTGGPSSAITDQDGHYRLPGVPAGRYAIAFVHPLLDSLQLESRGVALVVNTGDSTRADLSTPSRLTIRTIYCGTTAPADSDRTGLLLGTVYDTRGDAPAAGARVSVRATSVSVRRGQLAFDTLGADAHTSRFGAYVICGLPAQETMSVVASNDSGASTAFEMSFPESGVAIRDIHLGAAGVVGVIHGRIVQPAGIPVVGARIIGPAPARVAVTDTTGRFTMTGVPSGTHGFTVHAIGYTPRDWLLDVTADTMTRIFTLYPANLLDTVRIIGRRMTVEQAAFLQRRASGFGKVFERKEVEHLDPFETTDLLRRVAGVRIVQSANTGYDMLRVRGGECLPTFILDGRATPLFESLDEINVLVKPQEIQAMEVYTSAYNPLGTMTNGFCATILVWTRAEMGAAASRSE